jgi:MATE family multidrug resistance protein
MFIINNHIKNTIYLAWPLVITQVGYIITGMVDTVFLGKIGAAEQAACILSNNLYILLLVFGIGVSYATTPLVTSANQNMDLLKKASLFKNSIFLNVSVSIICFIVLFLSSGLLKYMHQPEDVIKLAVPFFNVLIFSMIPISLFFTCKQYCEGLSNTRMALFISIIGNVINIVLNYLLIYGKFGFPELGYIGSAWASFISRVFMGFSFLYLIFKSPVTKEISAVYNKVKINKKELFHLAKIGLNAGLQLTFEVAAFVIAGLMAGTFGKEQIDAHGIALSIAAFTYMFASGISSASSIRVGIYKAQDNWLEIKQAAFSSIKLVMLIMGGFAILFLMINNFLPKVFSSDLQIVNLASKLLIIAALFQLFDGIQVTIVGILRGLEDFKIPTLISLVGYWIIALPLAYWLAFILKLETVGVWIGLLVSLIFAAIVLFWRLNYLINKNLKINNLK